MTISLVRREVDSSQGGELGSQADFFQAKNLIINSNFDVWQRGTSFTGSGTFLGFNTAGVYNADRWVTQADGTMTGTISRQSFTVGQTLVPNAPKFFWRFAVASVSGATVFNLLQRIEDVTLLAGKTVTLSFWAKADASRTITSTAKQVFGTGGSPSSTVSMGTLGTYNLTTSFQQFTVSWTFPAITGATLGTTGNDYSSIELDFPLNTVCTIDIAQVMLNVGSLAGPWNRAGVNIGHELALCQRYLNSNGLNDEWASTISTSGVKSGFSTVIYPTTMRATPSFIMLGSANVNYNWGIPGIQSDTISTITTDNITKNQTNIRTTLSTTNATNSPTVLTIASGGGFFFDAEL